MQKKQLKTLLICLIVTIALLVKPALAFAASSVVSVSADKTEAEPGEVITFSVILGPVKDMGTMQMQLVIPDGLSFVSGSGKLADDLKKTLGFDVTTFAESNLLVNGYASSGDYSSDSNTLICTFQCEVEEGFSGTAEVSLTDFEFYSCETWEDHTEEFSAGKAVIKVSAEQTPGGNEDPGQQTDPTPGGNEDPGQQTDPSPSGNEDPGQQTDPTPGGNEDPGQQTDPSPGGNEDPCQQTDPTPSDNEEPGQQTDPTPGGNEEPGQQTDPTPSGDTTPDDQKSSDDTATNENSPAGEDAPSGNNGEQTPSGDGGQSSSDPDSSDTNKVPEDSEKSPETDNGKRQDEDKDPQSKFNWWIIAVIALVAVLLLIFILKNRKTAKKTSIYRKK